MNDFEYRNIKAENIKTLTLWKKKKYLLIRINILKE